MAARAAFTRGALHIQIRIHAKLASCTPARSQRSMTYITQNEIVNIAYDMRMKHKSLSFKVPALEWILTFLLARRYLN